MPASPDSTLVFAFGALGDTVLLWPTLRAIRPATLVAPSAKARLAARWVEGVRAMDGDTPALARLFAHDPDPADEMPKAVRTLLGRAERIISFISDGQDTWAGNVRRLNPGARLHFVRPRPAEGETVPVVEHHRRQLAEQGWACEPIAPDVRRNPTGPVVVHPGSGGRAKCWAAERFERLIETLQAAGRSVVVVLGEAERERMEPRRLEAWRERWQRSWRGMGRGQGGVAIEEPADVLELGELLAGAELFVGNDSGPTHLAAQLGVPTVALFGPTDPRIWAPRGPAVTVLAPTTPRPMGWLGVRPVVEAVERAALAGAEPGRLS